MGTRSLLEHLSECRKRLEEKGFNLWGITAIDDFDAISCRGARLSDGQQGSVSAVVIGAGGRTLGERLREEVQLRGKPRRSYHPIDAFTERTLLAEVKWFRDLGYRPSVIFPFDRRPRPVNFPKLAEAAGIGVISPVVPFLLHPEYGPWVSLRGALMFQKQIPSTNELRDFAPCSGCDAPCLRACPVSVYGPEGKAHLDRCGKHRHRGGCMTGCDVRRACRVGAQYRYPPEEEAFRHAYSLPTMRRYYGLGLWKLVPAKIRRSL